MWIVSCGEIPHDKEMQAVSKSCGYPPADSLQGAPVIKKMNPSVLKYKELNSANNLCEHRSGYFSI